MPDQPFDYSVVHPREKPTAGDENMQMSASNATLRHLADRLLCVRGGSADPSGVSTSGFFADGFRVVPVTDFTPLAVDISPGTGLHYRASGTNGPQRAVGTVEGLNDLNSLQPLVLSQKQRIVVDPQPPMGTTRMDIIEVRADRFFADPSTRPVFDEPTGDFIPGIRNKTLTYDTFARVGRVLAGNESVLPISYKVGVADVTGAEQPPAASVGYLRIATIRVRNAVDLQGGVLQPEDLADVRRLLFPSGTFTGDLTYRVSTVGANPPTPELLFGSVPPGILFSLIGSQAAGGACALVVTGPLLTFSAHVTVSDLASNIAAGDILFSRVSSILATSFDLGALAAACNTAVAAPQIRIGPRQPGCLLTFHTVRMVGAAQTLPNGTPANLYYTITFRGSY